MTVAISNLFILYVVAEASWNIFDILFGAYIVTGVWSNFKMYQHVSTTLVLLVLQVYLLKQYPKLNFRICFWQARSDRFLGFIFKMLGIWFQF
jgi:hypothetical protein